MTIDNEDFFILHCILNFPLYNHHVFRELLKVPPSSISLSIVTRVDIEAESVTGYGRAILTEMRNGPSTRGKRPWRNTRLR
jgi:hypothetical protein